MWNWDTDTKIIRDGSLVSIGINACWLWSLHQKSQFYVYLLCAFPMIVKSLRLRRFVANPTRYPLHHHLRIQRVCPKKRPNEDKCREFDECCQLSAASPRHKKSHSGKLLTDYSLFGLRFVSTHSQKLGTVLYMGIMFYITHVLLLPKYQLTASPKVLKFFSHPQTRHQRQVVQNDKLSQESVETKIFVGGNGTFSHFFEKKLKKIWKKISKKNFFLLKFVFLS